MSTNKEWLPYVHVSVGPRGGDQILIMASDVAKTGMINKWAYGTASEREFYDTKERPVLSWAIKAANVLEDFVDPETLEYLKSECRVIQHRLSSMGGGVWVSPRGVIDLKLQPSAV